MSAFVHRLRVRYQECDPQGIVFNANYVAYVDIALTELWRSAFGSYDQVVAEHGIDLVVGSLTIDFRSSARPDDLIDLGDRDPPRRRAARRGLDPPRLRRGDLDGQDAGSRAGPCRPDSGTRRRRLTGLGAGSDVG